MQASRRNTQRKNDYSSLSTMVTSYSNNNNGKMPAKIVKTWMNADGKDPDGEEYTETNVTKCTNTSCTAATVTGTNPSMTRNSKQVYVYTAATCDGGTVKYKAGERNFVVWGYIEDGANTPGTYCLASNA